MTTKTEDKVIEVYEELLKDLDVVGKIFEETEDTIESLTTIDDKDKLSALLKKGIDAIVEATDKARVRCLIGAGIDVPERLRKLEEKARRGYVARGLGMTTNVCCCPVPVKPLNKTKETNE